MIEPDNSLMRRIANQHSRLPLTHSSSRKKVSHKSHLGDMLGEFAKMSYSIPRIIALRALVVSMPLLAVLDACLEEMISPVLRLPIWIVFAGLIIIEILHIIEGGHMIGFRSKHAKSRTRISLFAFLLDLFT